MIKAYYIFEKDNRDDGGEFVLAENANKAKSFIDCDFINARAVRIKAFDKYIQNNQHKARHFIPTDLDLCKNGFTVPCSKCGDIGLMHIVGDKFLCDECKEGMEC